MLDKLASYACMHACCYNGLPVLIRLHCIFHCSLCKQNGSFCIGTKHQGHKRVVTRGWWQKFCKCHNDFALRTAVPLSIVRAMATDKDVLDRYIYLVPALTLGRVGSLPAPKTGPQDVLATKFICYVIHAASYS